MEQKKRGKGKERVVLSQLNEDPTERDLTAKGKRGTVTG